MQFTANFHYSGWPRDLVGVQYSIHADVLIAM